MVHATAQTYTGRRPGKGCLPDMDDRQFTDWVELLERRIGLFISEDRRSFLNTGLRLRMKEIGCSDYRDYYRRLSCQGPQAQEWTVLVDRLTVHETRFFRHRPSLDLLLDEWLPAACAAPDKQCLRVWSVGCATGEETYSLAMLIDDYLMCSDSGRYFGVTGTDISLPALSTARTGVYDKRRLADIDPVFRERYCRPVSDSRFEIDAGLRKRVCFAQLNLREVSRAPFAGIDLIYCQNLLIYFNRDRRVDIANHLAACLGPGGVLVLGPGELMGWQHRGMEKIRYDDTLAYRRVADR